MKYVFFLLIVLGAYWYLTHQAPVKPAVEAIKQDEVAQLSTGPRAQPSTAPAPAAPQANSSYKRAIDRTHDVLQQVKGRNGNGEF